jgi:nitrite reductase/ring-hydroxylating ferredoxin subunit
VADSAPQQALNDQAGGPENDQAIADPSGYGDPTIGAALARTLAEARVDTRVQQVGPDGKFVVGSVDDIPPGSRKVIEVDGRQIGVFNVNGEYFAVLNRCPHQGGPLCSGRQTGFLVAPTPGDYQLTRPGEVIRCPWHGWEFDLRTGQSWCEPSRVRVRRYDVSVQLGESLVVQADGDVPSAANPEAEQSVGDGESGDQCVADADSAAPPGLVKGPYKAETFPVSVEQRYVVIDLGGRRVQPDVLPQVPIVR